MHVNLNHMLENTLSFLTKSEEGVKMNNSDYKIDLSKRQLYEARRLDLWVMIEIAYNTDTNNNRFYIE
jgi:hypothetical protein